MLLFTERYDTTLSALHPFVLPIYNNLHAPYFNYILCPQLPLVVLTSSFFYGLFYSKYIKCGDRGGTVINPYPTAFPYGNGMVLHFYQQQESSTTKTVHKVINKGLKTYV